MAHLPPEWSVERFWAKVRKSDGCWEWTGAKAVGYGHIRIHYRLFLAHRVAYELLVGPIPDGFEMDHLCRNPGCVNPAHVEPVTHTENVRRGNGGRPQAGMCQRGLHPMEGDNLLAGKRRCRECKRGHYSADLVEVDTIRKG